MLPLFTQKMFGQINSFTLLALPYFILAGSIMSSGGISQRLVDFARTLVGHLQAGLAHAAVVASMVFAGVSGSSTADASAIGAIVIPTMKKAGYKPGFAAALIAVSGTIGSIIPPSMTMVVYGALAQVSIGGLFLGGIIPGILVGLFLMTVVKLHTLLPAYPELREVTDRFAPEAIWRAVRRVWSALLAPVIIIGGILSGVFTATEAGVIACIYAFVVSYFIYRSITLADMGGILIDAAITTAMVSGIIAVAGALGWLLAYLEFNETALRLITAFSHDKTVVLLILTFVMLGLTMFVELLSVLLVFVPVAVQIGRAFAGRPLPARPDHGDGEPDRRDHAADGAAPVRDHEHRRHLLRPDGAPRLAVHRGRAFRPPARDLLRAAGLRDPELGAAVMPPLVALNPAAPAVLQDLARRVVARDAGDAAARMGRRAAEIEPADRASIVGKTRRRALPEQLVERQFAVEDVAVRDVQDLLDVGRQQHLHVDDLRGEAGRELVDHAQHVPHQAPKHRQAGCAAAGPAPRRGLAGVGADSAATTRWAWARPRGP